MSDPITKEDIEMIVKRTLGDNSKIINYRVKNYSEEKLGFLGAHHHLTVTICQGNISEEIKILGFFIKSVPYNITEQAFVIEDSKAFFKETNFYKRIVPELMNNIKDRSWLAQCYLIKDDVMVFEDLQSRNFTLKGHFLKDQCLKSALTALANLHASSMLAEKRLGRAFNEFYPDLMSEGQFDRDLRFYDWFRVSVDALVSVARHLELDSACIPKVCDRIFDKLKASNKWRNVLCHGDLKAYNMMFNDSTELVKCVLIDFQLFRYCPPTTDILQMMYLSTRREFREKYEIDLLKYYHESLCRILNENNKECELPKFGKILEEYSDMRVVGVVTASLFFQIMLLEGKKCAELTKNSNGYANLYFEDRVKLVLDTMKHDENYNEIMTEITKEMVERSKQFI